MYGFEALNFLCNFFLLFNLGLMIIKHASESQIRFSAQALLDSLANFPQVLYLGVIFRALYSAIPILGCFQFLNFRAFL